MEFELNLIDNSYDYLCESLSYYKKVGYYETHDPDTDTIEEKKKWKTTFVLLVQAVELLLKEKLSRVNPVFLFEDIDSLITDKSKTITFNKSLQRLINIDSKLITDSEKQILTLCGNIRNECIHYKVKLNSVDIKKKYCKLFEIYMKLHSRYFNKKYINEEYQFEIKQILEYAKGFEVFRGSEFKPNMLKSVKKDIQEAQKKCFAYNNTEAYIRVKFGDESEFLNRKFDYGIDKETTSIYNFKYCGDCLAEQGEYHALGCDCELCPKCGKQFITCGCFDDCCSIHKASKDDLELYL